MCAHELRNMSHYYIITRTILCYFNKLLIGKKNLPKQKHSENENPYKWQEIV